MMQKEGDITERRMLRADDVANLLFVSKSKAYLIIKQLNQELEEKGFLTIAGRIPERYLLDRMFPDTGGNR